MYDVQKQFERVLVEENESQNSTKRIRLSVLDFYELIVNSAFGFFNYYRIKILSEVI